MGIYSYIEVLYMLQPCVVNGIWCLRQHSLEVNCHTSCNCTSIAELRKLKQAKQLKKNNMSPAGLEPANFRTEPSKLAL